MRQGLFALLILASLAHAYPAGQPTDGGGLEIYSRSAVEDREISLTHDELKWLHVKKEISIGVSEPDYRPFDITANSNRYEGISADVIGAISQILRVKFTAKKYTDRASAIKALKSGEIDLLASANGFDVSDKDLTLTKPYAPDQPAIFSRLSDLRDFSEGVKGLHIAVPYDYITHDVLLNNYQDAFVKFYKSRQEALAALAFGRADIYLGDVLSANLLINENYFNYVKAEALVDIDSRGTGFAVKKRDQVLLGLINKAIAIIGTAEFREIARRWAGGTRAFSPIRVNFTEAERRWIAKNPVLKVAIGSDQAPIAFVDTEGNFGGIASDILKIARIETGIRFLPVYMDRLSELQESVINNETQLAVLTDSPAREGGLRFTDSFYASPFAIVVDSKDRNITELDQLRGKTVAIPKGHVLIDALQKDYKDIGIVESANLMEAMSFVSDGKADATITPLNVFRYYLSRMSGSDLYVSNLVDVGSAKFPFAVGRSSSELQSILNKVIMNVPPDELNVIGNRWRANSAVRVKTWGDYRPLILQIVGVGLLLLGVSLIWNAYLRRQVAQRRQAESALGEQLQFMQALINGTPHPIYVRDREGRLISCNSHYLMALGRTHDQVIGYRSFESAKINKLEAESLHSDYMEVMRTEEPIQMDRPLHLQSKVTTIYHWIYPYKSTSGEVQGVICGWIDISERRRLVDALEEAKNAADDANRAKTTFLATMSHEIRTPMNAIIGLIELSLRGMKEGRFDHSLIEVAHDSATSLLDLIGDILDVARIESGNLSITPRRANLRELSESVLRVFDGLARQKGLALRYDFDNDINIEVQIDPVRYKQILSNLISNSIKFTEEGAVDVKIAGDFDGRGEVYVKVEVKDTGIGISDADQERMFKPFEQANGQENNVRGGAGLGLAICRTLAEMMGGTLELASRLGVGTSVEFSLSLCVLEPLHEEVLSIEAEVVQPLSMDRVLRVLVVDDNPANRLVLSQQLEYLGHEVSRASNGVEALRIWNEHEFDIIITDCNMPLMSGYDLVREIREEEAQCGLSPSIVVGFTASAQPEEAQRCLNAGMNDCLFKPVKLDDLAGCILKWIGFLGNTRSEVPPEEADVKIRWIDLGALKKITKGDDSALFEILREFMASNSSDIGIVNGFFGVRDVSSISEAVHRIKGGAKMLGALDLVKLCESLEGYCQISPVDWSRLEASIVALGCEINNLNFNIQQVLDGVSIG